MERSVAVKRLHKMLGPKFGYQIDPKALMHDEREAEKEQHQEAVTVRDNTRAELQRMRTEHMAKLEATDEYKAIQLKLEEQKKRAQHLAARQMARRFTVGTSNSLFFHVAAEGDSWEEIFDKLKEKKL